MSNFNFITSQQQNREKPIAANMSEVAFIETMDAQGNPTRTTPESLQLNQNDFNEAVNEKLIKMHETTADHTEQLQHLGVYSKRINATLSSNVATGKILTTLPSGEVTQVAQQGWNISRIDIDGVEVTSGDTVFLPLLSAQGENLLIKGVVPFARLIETKDSEGQVVRQTIKSLYGASNTDICEWGGIKKELALRTGEALLICHPAVITEVVIGRNAEDASSAAAQLRQEDALDEKANLSGFHGAMITGGAISLVPEKAEDSMPAYTENLPAARMVGDAGALTSQAWAQGVYPHFPHVPDDAKGKRSSLSIERVEGECLGVNQMVQGLTSQDYNGVMLTYSNGIITLKGTASADRRIDINAISITQGHQYEVVCVIKNNGANIPSMRLSDQVHYAYTYSDSFTTKLNGYNRAISLWVNLSQGKSYDLTMAYIVTDLTLLFPTPSGQAFVAKLTNTQSSALAVCNKLGYASVITYDE